MDDALTVLCSPQATRCHQDIATGRVEASAYAAHLDAIVRVEPGRGLVFQPVDGGPPTTWPVLRRRQVEDLAMHPDGRACAALVSGLLWVDEGLVPQMQTLPGGTLCVHIDADGQLAAGGGSGRVWISREGAPFGHYVAHEGRVEAIDRCGNIVLSGATDGRVVRTDLEAEQMQTFVAHADGVSAAVLVDASSVASASADGCVKLWEVASGQARWSVQLPEGGPIHGLAVLGEHLLASGRDRSIRLLRLADGTEAGLFVGHSRTVAALMPTGPRRFWSLARDRRLIEWDLEDRQSTLPPFFGHTDGVRAVHLGPSHAWTASRDGTLRRWDLDTRRPEATPLRVSQGAVQVLLEEADQSIVFGGTKGTVGVVDPQGRTRVHRSLHEGPVTCLRPYGPDLLVTGGADGVLRTWNRTTLAPVAARRDHTDRVRCLAVVSPEAGIVTGSYDHTLLRVDPLGGEVVARFEGHSRPIISVAVVGELVVSGSLDGSLRTWQLDGRPQHVAEADPAGVVGVIPVGGRRVLAVGREGRVGLWAVDGLSRLSQLELGVPLDGVDARPAADGSWRVLIGDQRGGLHLLRVAPPLQTAPSPP